MPLGESLRGKQEDGSSASQTTGTFNETFEETFNDTFNDTFEEIREFEKIQNIKGGYCY